MIASENCLLSRSHTKKKRKMFGEDGDLYEVYRNFLEFLLV